MSTQSSTDANTPRTSHRVTIPALMGRKGGEPVVCLTAYNAPLANILDDFVDLLLVGDSMGMVLYGHKDTLPMTLDTMIGHAQAVMRATSKACVIVDLPFGSYEESPEQAYRNAVRVMKEVGCTGVKLEGGRNMASTIAFLTQRGIPVMGHIGLMPQSINVLGGFKARGRQSNEWDAIQEDARAVAAAGAFSIVVEGVAEPLARQIASEVPCLTIGIGASAGCDGQILVTEDMLGLFERVPRFVKKYADLRKTIAGAVGEYAADVRARKFPGPGNTY